MSKYLSQQIGFSEQKMLTCDMLKLVYKVNVRVWNLKERCFSTLSLEICKHENDIS